MPITKHILLINLGSPAKLSVPAIRYFLANFLSDKRVVGLPKLLWYPILYGIILPLRAKNLVSKYREIWFDECNQSPLVYYTLEQARKLQLLVDKHISVHGAFCYGENNIQQLLTKISDTKTIDELIIIPLYPQYSSSTTGAVFDQVSKFYTSQVQIPSIRFIRNFASNQMYINALANKIRSSWEKNGRSEKLVVSFHSLPQKLIELGDSYLKECQITYQLLCENLAINPDSDATLTFQSKFGRAKWITPVTSDIIGALAKSGISSIDVICPGFVSDCLETLEEINIFNRELFYNCGGQSYNYITCLNDSDEFIEVLADLIKNELRS